jgi:signal transduction histidine kinase
MLNRLLKQYRLKNTIALIFILSVIAGISTVSYINYTLNKNLLYQSVDSQLKSVALNTALLLDAKTQEMGFFDKNITSKKDMQNIIKLSKLAKNAKVAYVYTMIKKDDNIYFTSSSATDEEIKNNEATKYLDKYDEATQLLKKTFDTHKITYEESTDRWGTFRTVFIPMQTKNGIWYIAGADIKITYISQQLNNYIKKIFFVELALIVIILILGIYFRKISKHEFTEITKIETSLKDKIAQKTEELRVLNHSLENRVQKEIEKNRKKDKAMQQQQKLAQMGEMLSMIAHQWRQPLSAISSSAGALKLKARLNKLDTKTSIELSDDIIEFSQHLSATIDDFRKFFKSNKELKSTNYKELVDSVLHIAESSLISKNIKIVKEVDDKYTFQTHPNELKQVILNLIKNAEDILLERDINNPTITIKTDKNILTISDNGGGIPEDIIDKIFEPYFSTKEQKDGTGLGLYMSKTIVEQHCSGKLNVSNNEYGAVFKIIL